MIISHYDWEERQHVNNAAKTLDAMTAPTVQDAVDLAEIYK